MTDRYYRHQSNRFIDYDENDKRVTGKYDVNLLDQPIEKNCDTSILLQNNEETHKETSAMEILGDFM